MHEPRILTVQDISCVGQCSMTVALPILSACGIETAVIPSAVLSTHTGGKFKGFTFRDLTEDIPGIREHWEKQGIRFDAIYTGYLGNKRQIEYVRDLFHSVLVPGALKIVDPAMADLGKLYQGFDRAYVDQMITLCADADIILPNITEACMMTGSEFRKTYDEEYTGLLIQRLHDSGMKTVVLTGVGYDDRTTGILVSERGKQSYYSHRKLPVNCHGTGDIYASSFVGGVINGIPLIDSVQIAAEYTVQCIENTLDDPEHWYGARFEGALPWLIQRISEARDRRQNPSK